MDLKLQLPKVDSTAMGREFLRRRLLRKVADTIEGIGRKNIEWLISNDKDFKDVLPKQKISEITAKAGQYGWVKNIVTVDDIIAAQPEWVNDIIETHGQKAVEWFGRQFNWIQEIMGVSASASASASVSVPTSPSSSPPNTLIEPITENSA